MDNKFELIVAIINRGFSDLVMDSARASGATGGTILNARGTVVDKAQTIMGISIQPEKEVVLILTKAEKRDEIMAAICKSAGLNTLGKGIVFSLLVEDVLGVGLTDDKFTEFCAEDKVKTHINELKAKSEAVKKAEADKKAELIKKAEADKNSQADEEVKNIEGKKE